MEDLDLAAEVIVTMISMRRRIITVGVYAIGEEMMMAMTTMRRIKSAQGMSYLKAICLPILQPLLIL